VGRVDDADHLTRLRELLSGSSQVILDTNALIYFLQGTAPTSISFKHCLTRSKRGA